MSYTIPKQKTCRVCKTKFTPAMPLARVCSPMCGLTLARAKREQKDRKETKQKLDEMRTKPHLVKLAQTAFNSFIKARDAGKPCICCGKPLQTGGVGGGVDAGHYRSVGSAPHMRFVEDNCHSQAKFCNRHLAGNHVAYRAGLIKRIGLHSVEMIEADQTLRKYTKEGLLELAKHYNAAARALRAAASKKFKTQSFGFSRGGAVNYLF